MERKAYVVVGLGFGDEGKGLATDYLCSYVTNPLVIRFNGGHQAGHTVVTKSGHKHVFSTLGAGTLRGVPTYWSSYCTFSPAILLPEYSSLGIQAKLFVDNNCPVTTHYDVLYNRAMEATRGLARHGSCGLGFGATIERHQLPELQLFPADLLSPALYKAKLQLIRSHYQAKVDQESSYSFNRFDHDAADHQFGVEAEEVRKLCQEGTIQLVNEDEMFAQNASWQSFIFEGAQGILLDMDFGTPPHITRSNTTSKNALEILKRQLPATTAEIMYVTRCYQTRHGAGPLASADESLELVNNDCESNQYNEHQGQFRVSNLNLDSLNYALSSDANFSRGLKKHLLITCLDQLGTSEVPFYLNETPNRAHYTHLPSLLHCQFASHRFSFNSCADYLSSEG
ncbi:adenylosuccinate synthetase [Hymenobacter sp. B1770]|uniref:adenylosuccinate synthetase n=1 Tax=Hymenobacter sp. B1770 TaxID=1718788 RepID=UPI003CF682E0